MDHWNKYCTLSLVHFMAFPETQGGEGPFVQSIQQLAALNFFGALEMGHINNAAMRIEVKRVAKEQGLKVGFGAQPLILSQSLDLNSLDPAHLTHSINTLKQALDHAAEMEADRFVVLSGKDPGEENRARAQTRLVDSLQTLGEYASQYGIRLVLETFDRLVDKCALVGPSNEAAALAKAVKVNYPEFGLLYDMGHMPLLGETPIEALSALKGTLAEVHLGNCVLNPSGAAYGDKHPRFGFPGGINGTNELVEFLQALFISGYLKENPEVGELPWVGFEVRPQIGETTEEILENIQQTWEEAWEQLQLIHTGEIEPW